MNKDVKLNINISQPDLFKDAEIITIRGKKGETGDKGDRGFDGVDGIDGENGIDGLNGLDGAIGKDGEKGMDGESPSDQKLEELITALIPEQVSLTAKEVIEDINSKREVLEFKTIKGLSDEINNRMPKQMVGSPRIKVLANGIEKNAPLGSLNFSGGTLTNNGQDYTFVAGATDLSPYWKRDGTSTATGNWNLGTYSITAALLKGQYSNLLGSAYINPDGSAVFGGGTMVVDNGGNITANTGSFSTGRVLLGGTSGSAPSGVNYAQMFDNGGVDVGLRAAEYNGGYSEMTPAGVTTSGTFYGTSLTATSSVSTQYSVPNYLMAFNDFFYGGYGSITIGDNTSLQQINWQIWQNGTANFAVLPGTSGISMQDSGGGFPMLNINNVASIEGDIGTASFVSGAITLNSGGTINATGTVYANSFNSSGGSYLDSISSLIVNTQILTAYQTLGNQFQVGHNFSNYMNLSVGPTGTATFSVFGGSGTSFVFSHDVKIGAVGRGLFVKEGTNATMGRTTLVAGSKVVTTNKVTALSEIQITVQSLGTVTVPTPVAITTRTAGTSFTITSSNVIDTSVVSWIIIEPA